MIFTVTVSKLLLLFQSISLLFSEAESQTSAFLSRKISQIRHGGSPRADEGGQTSEGVEMNRWAWRGPQCSSVPPLLLLSVFLRIFREEPLRHQPRSHQPPWSTGFMLSHSFPVFPGKLVFSSIFNSPFLSSLFLPSRDPCFELSPSLSSQRPIPSLLGGWTTFPRFRFEHNREKACG